MEVLIELISLLLIFIKVKENFIPPLLSTVLDDYSRNVPQAREAEVLNTMATIISKLEVIHYVRILCSLCLFMLFRKSALHRMCCRN